MIDRIGRAYGVNTVSKVRKPGKISDSDKKDGPKSGDGLEVSSFGQVMSKAMSSLKEIPDVRENKVEAIRSQVASGTYSPDMNTLAAKLLQIGITRETD